MTHPNNSMRSSKRALLALGLTPVVAPAVAEHSSAVVLRPARPEEASGITALALRSKAAWGYDQAFMDACTEEMTVTGKAIANSQGRIVVAQLHEALCGYYHLTPTADGVCELEALFVDSDRMRQGIGGLLLRHAVKVAERDGANKILVQSDPFAGDFYEKAGAQKVGEQESGSIAGRFLPLYQFSLDSSISPWELPDPADSG